MQLSELKSGYRIPASSFTLEPDKIEEYLEAAEESSGYFIQPSQGTMAPPTVCVSLVVATLCNDMKLPQGTIHLSQEIAFKKLVKIGQTLRYQASVTRNQVRRGVRIISLRIEISDALGEKIMDGVTSFVISEQTDEVT